MVHVTCKKSFDADCPLYCYTLYIVNSGSVTVFSLQPVFPETELVIAKRVCCTAREKLAIQEIALSHNGGGAGAVMQYAVQEVLSATTTNKLKELTLMQPINNAGV